MIQKVLISESLHPDGMKLLEDKGFDIVVNEEKTQEAFEKHLPDAEAVVLRTNVTMTAETFEAAKQLKVIARTGAGVDNVDVAAATSRGILVCNLPGVNSVSVAEHTAAMLLSLGKQLPYMDRSVREGNWQARRSKVSMELEGKILGVVAMGNVGSKVAQKLHYGFGMRVLAYDPYAKEKFVDYDYEFVDDVTELFKRSDFVALHCPNIPETRGLVTNETFDLMKPSAYLINTARGEIVVREALVDALKHKKIAGAALDVFEEEPLSPEDPLCNLDNVILSPHVAALTKEVTAKAAYGAAKAIADYAEGTEPASVYNRRDLGA